MNVKLQEIFATPVAVVDGFLDRERLGELENSILNWETATEGETKSNLKSWHSPATLLEHTDENFRHFTNALISFCERFFSQRLSASTLNSNEIRYAGWANVTRCGGMNMPHLHPGAVWAAVFYVRGMPSSNRQLTEKSGYLVLEDFGSRAMLPDRNLLGEGQPNNYWFKPDSNQLILFPAYVPHWVSPLSDIDDLRISIAVNISFLPVHGG